MQRAGEQNHLGEGDGSILLRDHPVDGARRKIGTVPDGFVRTCTLAPIEHANKLSEPALKCQRELLGHWPISLGNEIFDLSIEYG
jgi:hypothetical protein